MSAKLLYAFMCFVGVHTLVWFASNSQFISEAWKEKSFWVMIALSVPISLLMYYGTRFGYEALNDSAWGVRLFAYGTSYLTFPLLTWLLLDESMFTAKTLLCILLSIAIILIQVFL